MDLDEAFTPYDHALGISARAMRKYWRRAALIYLRQGKWAYSAEALVNQSKRFPPANWKTGDPLILLSPK